MISDGTTSRSLKNSDNSWAMSANEFCRRTDRPTAVTGQVHAVRGRWGGGGQTWYAFIGSGCDQRLLDRQSI